MEKLIRDKYPELMKNSKNPIVWRKVKNVKEHVTFLLAKISEEEKEFDEAHMELVTYEDIRADMSQDYEVSYSKAINEAGDVLEVYDVSIEIQRENQSDNIRHLIKERADFILKIQNL
jgi:hypothetical protein